VKFNQIYSFWYLSVFSGLENLYFDVNVLKEAYLIDFLDFDHI